MITIGEAMDYIEGLAIDNPSLFDAPIHNFVIRDEDDNEFVITIKRLVE
jgi:hypothetical protein